MKSGQNCSSHLWGIPNQKGYLGMAGTYFLSVSNISAKSNGRGASNLRGIASPGMIISN
jgi:hypothetical protein